MSTSHSFAAACAAGDLGALGNLLGHDASLARERLEGGTTGLHLAVDHPEAVRLLLQHGADPNARDVGDHALPLHGAAGGGRLESVRILLDAGSDVDGVGDVHRLEVIGWATVFGVTHREVVELLVERGAHHHVFSAIALGDRDVLRRVVAEDPEAISRRLSPFEQEQTALHYVIAPPDGLVGGLFRTGDHYRTLKVLIELGADLEARDAKGRTPLEIAMLRGDGEAMRLLHAAGASDPQPPGSAPPNSLSTRNASIGKITPMLAVPDLEATVAWYQAVGFELGGIHEEGGKLDWVSLSFGDAEIMLVPAGDPWRQPTSVLSLWIRTDRLDDLYAILRHRQLERARAALAGQTSDTPDVPFTLDLHNAFYGQREFGIRDPNGVELMFCQPLDQTTPPGNQ